MQGHTTRMGHRGVLTKHGPTGGGSSNSLQYSCLEDSMNSMKSQKNMILEDEPHRLEHVHYATGEE